TVRGQQRRDERQRRVRDILVALRDLVRAERRAAARAVRHALVAAVDQPLLVQPFEDRPDALDVLGVERDVRPRIVEPVADPLREPLPLLLVREDALATRLIESRDADLLDLPLAADAELLFGLDLYRQAVRVPA